MKKWRSTSHWLEARGRARTSVQTADRPTLALAFLFATSGTAHFVFGDSLIKAVPDWLPHRGSLVVISGILELVGAIGLVIPASRAIAGWCLLALLVAVFPANIKMLSSARAEGGPIWFETLLWIRLPLQFLLMWLLYRYAASPVLTRSIVESSA